MLPSGSPVSNLGSPPWTAFPVSSGQPQIPSAQPLSVDRLLPSIMGTIHQPYNRANPNVNHVSSIFSSMEGVNGSYSQQVPLSYALHPSAEHAISSDRSFQNAALTQPYPVQNCCSISQNSLPYGQTLPYLTSPLLPSICNGFLGNLPQPIPNIPHPQAALTVAAMAASTAARACDPLRHFGPTLMNQFNRRPRPSVMSKTNLYISGLNETDSDETLRHIVESVVQPKSCKAMTVNGKCKGYGFIDCDTEEEAEIAMERINEYSKATGKKLSVKFAFENEKDKLNVFVQHLPRSDYTTEDLMELFRPYGIITSAKLLDSMKGPTGIGFVRFSSPTEAEKAIKVMNKKNLCLGDNTKAVTCKLADKADTQRRNMASCDNARNRFAFSHNQNQGNATMIPQSMHASTIPTGHLTALTQPVSLPARVFPSMPAFSFEVPGFANQSATTSSMTGVMPTIGPSTLVQLPYASTHPGAVGTSCSTLHHRPNNPLIGPPPHTQISAQSPQYVANLVSAYLSSVDVQPGALKTAPTAVPSNRFPNNGASVVFHTGSSVPAAGVQSDTQLNTLPPNVQYALSYGQQSQQTIGSSGATAMSPQVVWLAPTYPHGTNASVFQGCGLAPAFQAPTMDQTKVTHDSQRSTPGLALQSNYHSDRAFIPTGSINTLTSMFHNLAINGPLEVSRFPPDSSLSAEPSRAWSCSKTAKATEDPTSDDQVTAGTKQVFPVSNVFETPNNAPFVDSISCETSSFITSLSTSLSSLDHPKHAVCFGVVNLPSTKCFPLEKPSATDRNDYEIFSDKKIPAVNGKEAALDVEVSASNELRAELRTNEDESTTDDNLEPGYSHDCVKVVPLPTSESNLMDSTVHLSSTTANVEFPS